MSARSTRRSFLQTTVAGTSLLGLPDLGFVSGLPLVSAEEARLDPKVVQLRPEIEPLVRLLEDTPRERLLEELAAKIKRGTSYQEVLAALMLAGVRNVEPRPSVGFKFHAVLVVNAAHIASQASPDAERWLPIFWAVDHFKGSQAQNVKERNGWRMPPVEESKVPTSRHARQAFVTAMDQWDAPAAVAAIAGLVRTAGADEVFELIWQYAPRDFRSIGHKVIFAANCRRTLAGIGWQHAEPILRSLIYAMLANEGSNPTAGDAPADRPGRLNRELAKDIRTDWLDGKSDSSATAELLAAMRQANDTDLPKTVVGLLNRGIGPQAVWDALLDGGGEILMRRPGIVGLHAVTTANAMRYVFETTGSDAVRRWVLLQTASFLALFRGETLRREGKTNEAYVDALEPLPLASSGPQAIEEICADISRDRMTAARKILTYVKANPNPKELIDAARLLIFVKGNDAHDYKFSAAVLEDFYHVSPAWRDKYLAASVFNLTGSEAPDNKLVQRARSALRV